MPGSCKSRHSVAFSAFTDEQSMLGMRTHLPDENVKLIHKDSKEDIGCKHNHGQVLLCRIWDCSLAEVLRGDHDQLGQRPRRSVVVHSAERQA